MIGAAISVVLVAASFVGGKVYGARVESAALAVYLKAKAALTEDAGKAYADVIAGIKADASAAVARVKKAL